MVVITMSANITAITGYRRFMVYDGLFEKVRVIPNENTLEDLKMWKAAEERERKSVLHFWGVRISLRRRLLPPPPPKPNQSKSERVNGNSSTFPVFPSSSPTPAPSPLCIMSGN
ncbi:hypothetical protein SUGI_0338810 [Cryptomeria japonica]|nr:hypothetical protein SUGI_0338810 [Cryptomeria japonica]